MRVTINNFMKIVYIDQYEEIIFEHVDSHVPCANDTISFENESYVVHAVERFPQLSTINVYLTDILSVKGRTDNKINQSLQEAKDANKKASLALKQTGDVKKYLSSIRNMLDNFNNSGTDHDDS